MFNINDIVKCIGRDLEAVNNTERLKVGSLYEVLATSVGGISDIPFCDVRSLENNDVITGVYQSYFKKNNKTNIKTTNMKIKNLVKSILYNKTRTLLKADFISKELTLTDEGISELLNLLFLENKEKLVKIAKEKLDEEDVEKENNTNW